MFRLRPNWEAANATLVQAQSALKQVENELEKKRAVSSRGLQLVSQIEIERLENTVAQRRGGVQAAQANIKSVKTQIDTVLPAQLDSAQSALEQAEVELGKTIIYAGVGWRRLAVLSRARRLREPNFASRRCSYPF